MFITGIHFLFMATKSVGLYYSRGRYSEYQVVNNYGK